MPFGRLTPKQALVVKKEVKGKVVHDLGAGDLFYAKRLLDWGASSVVAVEKDRTPRINEPNIRLLNCSFLEARAEHPKIVWLSWPQNAFLPGLLELLEKASTIIYLGKNTGGTQCGWARLYQYLATREVKAYLPDRQNVLIVYGQRCRKPRSLYGEERSGIDHRFSYSYEEAEAFPPT